jgi:hypothetical protein
MASLWDLHFANDRNCRELTFGTSQSRGLHTGSAAVAPKTLPPRASRQQWWRGDVPRIVPRHGMAFDRLNTLNSRGISSLILAGEVLGRATSGSPDAGDMSTCRAEQTRVGPKWKVSSTNVMTV